MFSGVKIANAILTPESVNVNPSIITETLSINDLLESIECLTRYIISRKRKNMSKLLEQINKEKIGVVLGDVSFYVNEKIDVSKLLLDNYISTENMMSNREGIIQATKLPTIGKVTKFQNGDILTSNIRPYFKKIWHATREGGCSNDVLVIRPKDRLKTDIGYLYYLLSDDNFFAYSVLNSHGTKMPRGDKDAIMKYEISLPSFPTQKKIASILGAYDEKIENNNKIIKNLEETAQTIFNEWFVNFKFPGYEKVKMVDSEMGEIPEGWKIKNVLDVIERISPGKKYDNKSASPSGNVPILDQGASGFIGYHDDEPGVVASIDNPVVVFTNHTCYYRILTEPFSCIQNVLPYIGKNGYDTFFVYFLTKEKIKMSEYKGHWPEFEQQVFVIPTPEIANQFSKTAKAFIKKIITCEKENVSLKSQRDLLLAKLI